MENASKALIIAGAILISILLIGVSMMIYNGSQKMIDDAVGNMDQQAKLAFNSKWTNYSDRQQGSAIKGLLRDLRLNASEDGNGKNIGRIPKVEFDGKIAECAKEGDNEKYINDLSDIEDLIEKTKTYNVKCKENAKTGLISEIIITEEGNGKSNSGTSGG